MMELHCCKQLAAFLLCRYLQQTSFQMLFVVNICIIEKVQSVYNNGITLYIVIICKKNNANLKIVTIIFTT